MSSCEIGTDARTALTTNEEYTLDGLSAICPYCRQKTEVVFIFGKFQNLVKCIHFVGIADGAIWFKEVRNEDQNQVEEQKHQTMAQA